MPSGLTRGWIPARVKKTHQIKSLEPRFDSIETGTAGRVARVGRKDHRTGGKVVRNVFRCGEQVDRINSGSGNGDVQTGTVAHRAEYEGCVRKCAKTGARDRSSGSHAHSIGVPEEPVHQRRRTYAPDHRRPD